MKNTFCKLILIVSIWVALPAQANETAADFVTKQFKTNGVYDAIKIAGFVDRLENEKTALISDMYETKIIEKIELEIDNYQDAVKSAKKELDEKKSKYALTYNNYLIPKIKELSVCAEHIQAKTARVTDCDTIADDFIIAYAGFYLPEAPRRIFHQDLDYLFIARNTLGYTYPRETNKTEAVNLIVQDENLAITKACLPEIKIKDILTQAQIQRLKNCQVDISIYNPAGESLWRKLSAQDYAEAKNRHEDWFPNDQEPIRFKQIKFTSAGSPKIEGEFERHGEDIEVKIKTGFETHTEIVTSMLGKMLGMYQDTSVHRKTVKIYLPKKMTHDAFRAQWTRRYANLNRDLNTYLDSFGKDDKGLWVILKDVQLSINDPKFLRVGPYEPTGWDLPNRREQRAQILWYGLVNMLDTKAGNHVLLMEKTDKGLVPHYSFQDVGYSLHVQFQVNFSRIADMIRSISAWGVNTFSDTFLKWDQEKVHVWWSDIMLTNNRFDTTTYSDVKWMARQIARIPYQDIVYAVEGANFPPEIADLYIKKITARRNEVVKAFELESEFPIYSVPDLSSYSPNNKVKNGKLVVSHFDGYASYELPRTTFISMILQGIGSFSTFKTLNDQLTAQVNTQIGVNVDPNQTIELKQMNIIPGIHIELNRSVNVNNQYAVKDGQSQGFTVKDRLAFEINVGSSIFGLLKNFLPGELGLNANVKAWRREYEFVHFAESFLQGYKTPFKLFNFVLNWKNCVVDCMGRGEVFKISDSYGIKVDAKAPLGAVVGVPVSVGAGVFWRKSRPTYFAKDQFNHLSIYQVKNSNSGGSASIGLDPLNLLLFNLPILELSGSISQFNHQSSLYRFTPSTSEENFNILTVEHDKTENDLLRRYLDSGDEDPSILARKELDITAKGHKTEKNLSFLLFWKKSASTGSARSTIKTSDKETRHFMTYTGQRNEQAGLDRAVLIVEANATIVSRDNIRIAIQMDEEKPENISSFVEVWNYDRKLDRQDLVDYIGNLNSLFSKTPNEPFYKDYYLPSAEDVNKYRKVYAHTRMYFYGDSLVNKLKTMTTAQLTELYTKTYKGNIKCVDKGGLLCKFKRQINDFVKSVANLKAHALKDETYLRLYHRLLDSLKIKENGIDLIKAVIDEKNIFVMGEIYGIYPSFSTLQQYESVAGRRFAAKSWGTYQIPPLRDFLHNHALKNESIYVNGEVNFEDIFGGMPSGDVNYY